MFALLSAAAVQRLSSFTTYGLLYMMLAYLVHVLLFTAPSRGGYHDNAGVLRYVNPKIGTYGISPNGNGGMIPSVSPPFGMTRWTPQTRENFISQCPYNELDSYIHGFQATHQPAIWMGESGQVVINPGIGDVQPLFSQRAHAFNKADEISTPYIYEVIMQAETVEAGQNLTESIFSPVPGGAQPVPDTVRDGANGRTKRAVPASATPSPLVPRAQSSHSNGTIKVAMTASSHVGHIRFDFQDQSSGNFNPYVFVQATRQNWTGHVHIDQAAREISGSNNQRQDYLLGPLKAPGFSGYFVSQFSHDFDTFGITRGSEIMQGAMDGQGSELGAFVTFAGTKRVEVRTGVSFVSIEQARRNLKLEAPSTLSFEDAVETLQRAWVEKLDRVSIEGVNATDSDHDPRTIWYTGLFHALQYPSDFSEPTTADADGERIYYSGYTDSVHTSNGSYYQSWSIWDTFRAEHSLLTMFAPERVNGMMRSLLQIYDWAGRLPMWANVVETNIMIGTHVDAVFANALSRGFAGYDVGKAWEAVKKNAYEPPLNDTDFLFYDRQGPNLPDEVRAGLTSYAKKGYVPNDLWSESGSRTLDYAFDDYAASVVAAYAGDTAAAQELRARSMNYATIYNAKSSFMEAKNHNGTWAGRDQGWTEGDDWIYTFNVMHDPLGLAELMGGPEKLKSKLDEYFSGGYNDHSNEPSHHAPYLYASIGYPHAMQNLTRHIAWDNYNATAAGLSGNEDLGQMSAWYVFSALGFYPVNPATDEYVVGSPFFERVSIRFPAGTATGGIGGQEHTLTITAYGAPTKPFVKSLSVDGKQVNGPILKHGQIVAASNIVFEMSDQPESWGQLST